MQEFKVSLIKSYEVKIIAKDIESAKRLTEYFTGNISDISENKDKDTFDFEILEIDNTLNEAMDAEEI